MTGSPSSPPLLGADAPPATANWWASATVLVMHVVFLTVFLPPTRLIDGVPLYYIDYSYHWHVASVSHESVRQGNLPWGVSPGALPGQWVDLSASHAVPYQLLGCFLGPTAVPKVILVSGLLLAPLCVLGGCAAFGIRPEYRPWVLLSTTLAIWLTEANVFMIVCGLMAFFPAAYLAFPTLGLFTRFADAPSWGRLGGFVALASVMFAFHAFSPLVILFPLAVLTLTTSQLGMKWRLAAAASPLAIAAANAWWLIPNVGYGTFGSRPDWEQLHPVINQGNMTFKNWDEFVAFITKPHQLAANAIGLALAGYGVWRAVPASRRAARVGLLTAVLGLLVIYWFGSFLGPLKLFQTNRFGMPFRLFLLACAAPVGALVLRRLRISPNWVVALVGFSAGVGLIVAGKLPRIPETPYESELTEWIRKETSADDRIALQTVDEDFRALALAGHLDREILSTCYPNQVDPVQFTATPANPPRMAETFLGRKPTAWTPAELRAALDRLGISVVITRSEEWGNLVESLPAIPLGQIGPYRMYRVSAAGERFAIGRGKVRASVNRLELTDLVPHGGRVVIKYRYHPGWSADGGTIIKCPTPDDRYGYLELRDPPPTVTLRFDPWRSLFAPWPPSAGGN